MVKKTFILYTRNFIFGSEDSLVSTVGLLAGIASAGVGRKEIIISGIVLICVEAFSMSVGSFLSERETEESSSNHIEKNSNSVVASVIMLVSYIVCGLIPLSPYFLMNIKQAFWWSIIVSIISLFILGFMSAKILKIKVLRTTLRMTIMGGMAIGLGVIVGLIMK
jgi:VIT1/CCC1 family predicted Fe2+/Mn2+ transporter